MALSVLDHFGVDGFVDPESSAYACGPEKVIAETAMLAYATSGVASGPMVRERLDELVRRLLPLARSERTAVQIALQPALATKFALPHVLLSRMGHGDARFAAFVDTSLRAAVRDGHDRTLTAHAEREWLSAVTGVQSSRSTTKADPFPSLLDHPLDVFHGLREDAYALTHLVFYRTDFGHDVRGLGGGEARVLAVVEALLAKYLDAEDYDLTGELLLMWPMTATRWSPAAAFTFRVLARLEQEAGVLPCGNVDPDRLSRLSGEARYRYALGLSYHTAYVMGFLCAAALRSGMATAVTGSPGAPALLDAVRERLDASPGHWQTSFADLAYDDQLVLVPLVLAIALVQRCRKRDYQGVFELLRVARSHSQPNDVVCQQAWELLERLDACSDLVRAMPSTPDCGNRETLDAKRGREVVECAVRTDQSSRPPSSVPSGQIGRRPQLNRWIAGDDLSQPSEMPRAVDD